MTSEVDGVSLT